jgi:hypothetical protein
MISNRDAHDGHVNAGVESSVEASSDESRATA